MRPGGVGRRGLMHLFGASGGNGAVMRLGRIIRRFAAFRGVSWRFGGVPGVSPWRLNPHLRGLSPTAMQPKRITEAPGAKRARICIT
jgi:hypothetical protein